MTRVALLWHMHQPYYEDLVTREHILPWVRLHALKDYYGMVALLEEFPEVRATFNLVPSLLVQLEAFAAGRAHDRYLELGLKPADALTVDEIQFVLMNFFHAQRQRMIEIYPRYSELRTLRGSSASTRDIQAAARRFTVDDLRDLQVWQKLAWMDPYYLERDERVRGLVARGRDFTEDDKMVLRAVELELLNAVIPAYRARAAAGQIEISTSPFYHPILPLLCDTDIYKRTHPESRMPRHRFRHLDDAREQLLRAAACHERLFGIRPIGLWPSEGSVSDDMIPLAVEAGYQWMATDEQILARSLEIAFNRDGYGQVDQPERLYTPYRVMAGGAQIACGFRDHALSDLIGFNYAGWEAEAAASDFVTRVAAAGRSAAKNLPGGEEPTIFVILDGENAWEYFDRGGRPFLRALYGRLTGHPELRTVTMADACRPATTPLHGIFPGSWIDANFYIWIGHQDDQRAWSQLAEARDALDSPGDVDPASVARAREEILIAEGSDWFWWYGDDHSSEHDLEFDDLFRRHLRNVYRLLQKAVPDELFVSNISAGAAAQELAEPVGLLTPRIDGEETSYFEWLGAGIYEASAVAGAMHQTSRHTAILNLVRFGFDRDRLYLRLDPTAPAEALFEEGHTVHLTFLKPDGLRVAIRKSGPGTVATLSHRDGTGESWTDRATCEVASASLLEVAVPFDSLRVEAGAPVAFFITLFDPLGAEIERHPPHRPIELKVPDAQFGARHWTA